jgi:chromosome segregation ATPase
VESTPTELDNMLNDLTKQNGDLDNVIQQLQADIESMNAKHASELQQRDDSIETLRQELLTARAQEDEIRSERDALREDMTALSQAYSSLEVEYRRLTNPEVEQPVDVDPSIGIPSDDDAMETLRAENARMRQEAQDADEWMSMAVDRMQSMTNDITALQEQVISLTAQLESASSVTEEGEAAALLAQEREARSRLDAEVARLALELSMRQGHSDSSEAQIQLYRNDLETYAQKLEEITAQRDQLQLETTQLNQQLRNLQSLQVEDKVEDRSSTEVALLRATVEDLQAQITQSRFEMESVLQREQGEIAARDARIQEIEALRHDSEQLQSLQQEVTQLTEANDAAQAWMSKAVEHHQLLTDQVASLTEQNADLLVRLNTAELGSNRNDSFQDPTLINELQADLRAREVEITKFKDVISKQQALIDTFSEMERELSDVRAHMLSLQNEIVSKDKEIESLRKELAESNLVDEYEDRSSLLESIQAELADKSEQVDRLTKENEELQISKKELAQKVDDLETIRIEAGTKEEEIQGLRARMAEAEARKEAIQSILDAVAREKEELALEFDKNQHALEKIESELNKVRRGDLDTTQSNEIEDNLEELQNTIKSLEAQLVSQCDEATSVVQQWNETYAELQASHEELESKLQSALDTKAQLEHELFETRQLVEKLKGEIQNGQNSRIHHLEALTENLKEQLSDQEKDSIDAINQWQDSYSEVEAKLSAVVAENESLVLQLEKAEERVQNEISMKNDENLELLNRLAKLEEQLTHQEEEARRVVQEWQECYKNVESELNEVVAENKSLMSRLKMIEANEKRPLEINPIDSSEGLSENNDDQMAELVLQIKNLEEQLADQSQDAFNIVNQWQESYNDVESRLSLAMTEKDEVTKQLQEILSVDVRENSIEGATSTESSTRQHRIGQLEQAVKQLEEQLLSHEEEASTVVTQWQQCYNDALAQHDAVLSDFQTTREALELLQKEHDVVVLEMKTNSDIHEKAVAELESTISTLQKQLVEHSDAANRLSKLQEYCDKISAELDVVTSNKNALKIEVSSLLQRLEDQKIESHDSTSKWQESFNDVSAKYESSEMEKILLSNDLADVKSALSSLQVKYDEVSATSERAASMERRLADSAVTIHDLQQQVDALNDIVNQWQESHGHVTEELKVAMLELQERRDSSASYQEELGSAHALAQSSLRELQEVKNSMEGNEATIRILTEQLEAHELEFSTLQQRYAEAESSRKESLSQSIESVNDLERQLWTREEDVRVLQESISVLQGTLQEKDSELARLSSELAEEREKSGKAVRSLETQLEELEEDARSTVTQWQRSYEALQALCDDSISRLEESRVTIEKLQSQLDTKTTSFVGQTICDEPSSREQALVAEIQELKDRIVQESIHAQQTVSQWQAEYNSIESELIFAVKEVEELTLRLHLTEEKGSGADVQSSESHFEKEFGELRIQNETLVVSLGEANIAKQELLQQVEIVSKNAANFKDEVDSLKTQLKDMNHLVTLLQSTKATSESELREHLKIIENLRHEMSNLSREKVLLSEQVSTLTDCSVQLGATKSDMVRMKEQFESQLRIAHSCNDQKEALIEELRRENATFIHERDALLLQLADLEDKLSEAKDTLQMHRTDLASKNAAEIAAVALREQVQSMYDQSQADHQAIGELSHARDIAEAEVERLRGDLATFLGVEDYESNRVYIEGRALDAAEALQRAERNEIALLRASLSRALEELALARSSEKELEERIAKATHQASLYEQEVITTKSDFQFLTRTMDEMRESESSRRMSLEYRISSLENEQKVLRHYHTTEMDNVRNELNYLTMERDRLYQSLKESEKSREILLHASSRDVITNGGDGDPYMELNRLRMEKAQLLASAADEAAQAEYRIREAQASAKAAADAEILVERELRVQAEKNLERNVLEMAELRMVGMDHRHGSYNIEILEQRLETAQNEILRLKAESQSLCSDCNVLREQLQDSKKESNMTIARLTEECRQAKARASHLEREGRFDAEVRVEVARLQAASSQSRNVSARNTPERSVVLRNKSTNNPAVEREDRDDEVIGSVTASKMYDAVQKQKKELEEERIVYFGLLSEHDELLASFAQQELVKESFKRALKRQCGTEAVDAALQEAEEQAQMKYGKYVKLN